ncbi:hypothetical protein K466DRAFT_65071 [Polyporus arcularius HHB13444]|uniref:Secreted protein n=1 Tax=Polyporus arcularius HHB13444 TaxID=1314778 RepID=A0A5C3PH93_9APHY|nr:hypothetical protein K466DRAFT_65071 [Polyporus arcularius HHB13444]
MLAMCALSLILCIRATLVEGSILSLLRGTERMVCGPNLHLLTPHLQSSSPPRARTCARRIHFGGSSLALGCFRMRARARIGRARSPSESERRAA